MLDRSCIFFSLIINWSQHTRSVPGMYKAFWTVLLVSLRWSQLRNSTWTVTRPCSHPPTHPYLLAGEDRGCWRLAPGTSKCQLVGIGSRNPFIDPNPAAKQNKKKSLSPPSSHPKAIRLLHPLCTQQKAEGRGKAWLCWMSPAGNDPLCASTDMPRWQKRLCSTHLERPVQPLLHG